MKENVDKQVERLIDKVMKQSTLETPSFDFTSLVMEKVDAIKTSTHTIYEPLISKATWLMLSGGFVVFIGAILWFGKSETAGWFDDLDWNILNTNGFSDLLNGLKFSQITNISILIFALMLLIQIPLLKNYFDKRVFD